MNNDLLKLSLNQGKRFNNYQTKIKNLDRSKRVIREGFVSSGTDTTADLNEVKELEQKYNKLMAQYTIIQKAIQKTSLVKINRLSPNNPYLGKNLAFTDGTICYVTNQGVARPYTSWDIYTNTSGKNGCPDNYISIDIPWSSSYIKGAIIPTNPPLIVGTPMTQGQSCGAEGTNVYASTLINNPSSEYVGCYNDKPPSTNIIVVPILNSSNSSNNFHAIASSIYLGMNDSVGPWAAFDQNPNTFWHSEVSSDNNYNDVTGIYEGINNVAISGVGTVNGEYLQIDMPTEQQITINQYSLAPRLDLITTRSPNSWYVLGFKDNQWYQVDRQSNQSFTNGNPKVYVISSPSAYTSYMLLIDKVGNDDQTTNRYCVQVAEWNLFMNSDSAFSDDKRAMTLNTSVINYTSFDNCQQYAVDNGYQYFGLQDYQPDGSAQCLVSNDIARTQIYGDASRLVTQIPLWSSNTSKQSSILSAQLAGMGQVIIYDINNAVVYTTNPEVEGCSSWGTIRVDSATYGGNCGAPIGNVTSKVSTDLNCEWKENCSIPISNATFGDPSKDCAKSFDVAYKCGGTPFTKNLASAEGQTMILDCSEHITNECKFHLILQDDGNLCLYKGPDPSNNKGSVWCSQTNGQQKTANPDWVSSKGKFGRNYLTTGDILGPDEWIGSDDGSLKLIMQSDGNLVLYTSESNNGCITDANGRTVGKSWVNAVYKLNDVGDKTKLGKIAYIDSESNLREYPKSMIGYSNDYQTYSNTDSAGSYISSSSVSDESGCQTNCNNNPDCGAYTYNASASMCWLLNRPYYEKTPTDGMILGIRNPKLQDSKTCNNKITNVDTIKYSNYLKGEVMTPETQCNVPIVTQEQRTKMDNILSELSTLGQDIASKMENLYSRDNKIYEQLNTDYDQFKKKIDEYKNITYKLNKSTEKQSNNNIEEMTNMNDINGMLTDSDLIVLQENYKYILWSILAVGTLTIAMNSMKK